MTAAPEISPSGPQVPGCLDPCRVRVGGFVARHLTWPGTLRLHRAAIGWDILRAPANVVLAPLVLLLRLGSFAAARLRQPRLAVWLAERPVLLRTEVSARVEAAFLAEVLAVPLPGPGATDRATLTRALFAAPDLRAMLARHEDGGKAAALRMMAAIAAYGGTRAAMAELTTALVTLGLGAVLFQALTPGMISMAPGLAEAVSQGRQVAEFPLGQGLGGLWYGLFPVAPPLWLLGLITVALVSASSLVAAFAGCLADPVQARLGLHRRRLLRLIDTLESEVSGAAPRPFATSEHYFARLFDLWDAAVVLLRLFRG